MLPVVEREPVHFPRVPAPSHQPRRLLRIGPVAPLAGVPLHPHHLPPGQRPRVAGVEPPLARQRLATRRAPPPVPRRPPGQLPQGVKEGSATFYDIHGRCNLWALASALALGRQSSRP